MDVSTLLILLFVALVAALLGAAVAWVVATSRQAASVAAAGAERDVLRAQLADRDARMAQLESAAHDDTETAAALAPLREAMTRVERQVGVLERDRLEQFGSLSEQLREVTDSTGQLRRQTAGLAGALNASGVRGAWGEAQLRRVVEHAGMLPRCDFDEQVSATSSHDAAVRPDMVVHLPGDRLLVLDAKAPMTAFLQAQGDGVTGPDRRRLIGEHARSVRGHVDTLAAKQYWSAFTTTPQMVICFVPADAMLAAAVTADPSLYDDAMARRVVLASPATLLAVLRSVEFAWRQDALATSARELLQLGGELYERLGTLGTHLGRMGGSLRKSVDHYNALVGALESRVFVSARKMHALGLVGQEHAEVSPLDATPRPLTAAELVTPELTLVSSAATPVAADREPVAASTGPAGAPPQGWMAADDGFGESTTSA